MATVFWLEEMLFLLSNDSAGLGSLIVKREEACLMTVQSLGKMVHAMIT